MRKEFANIGEFIKFKPNCVFCNAPLTPSLSNFITGMISVNKIPIINSKIVDNYCNFKFSYTSLGFDVRAEGHIDINSNELTFEIDPSSSWNSGTITYIKMVEIFQNFRPHIQLVCRNKKCKMNYYTCSNVFSCQYPTNHHNDGHYFNYNEHARVSPLLLYYEACSIGKYWVQSDWINKYTYIIRTTNPDVDPMKIPIVNFDGIDKEKFCAKIRTFITFS